MESSVGVEREEITPFFTPLSGLRLLLERGYVFDIEVSKLIDEDHPEFRERRWRVDVWESRKAKIKGVGEAPRKALAKNAALMDLLDKLRQNWLHEKIPQCKMPLGVRISPTILYTLLSFCQRKELPTPRFSTDLATINGSDKFHTTITVGDRSFSATSFEERYSKFHAALKAYKELSGQHFALDNVRLGSACLKSDEFQLIECEQTHVVMAKCELPGWHGGQLTKKRTHAQATSSCSLSPILKKIRKGMQDRGGESWHDNCQFRSGSRLSTSSRDNSDMQAITITSNMTSSPFNGLTVKLSPKGDSQVGSAWPFGSSQTSSPDAKSSVVSGEETIEDSAFTTPLNARTKKTGKRRLSPRINPENKVVACNSQSGTSNYGPYDVGSKTVWTQGHWQKAKLEVLKNLEAIENLSDSEDECDKFNDTFTTTLVTSGAGFNEHLFLADFKCGRSLKAAFQTSVDILRELDEI